MSSRRLRLDVEGGNIWIWYSRLDRRNGYLAWSPVGTLFKRRKLKHWLVALWALWRDAR